MRDLLDPLGHGEDDELQVVRSRLLDDVSHVDVLIVATGGELFHNRSTDTKQAVGEVLVRRRKTYRRRRVEEPGAQR